MVLNTPARLISLINDTRGASPSHHLASFLDTSLRACRDEALSQTNPKTPPVNQPTVKFVNATYLALTGPVDGAVTAAYDGFSVIKDERRWLTFMKTCRLQAPARSRRTGKRARACACSLQVVSKNSHSVRPSHTFLAGARVGHRQLSLA